MKHAYWIGYGDCVRTADWKEQGHIMPGHGYSILDLDLTTGKADELPPVFQCADINEYSVFQEIYTKEQHLIEAIGLRYKALMLNYMNCIIERYKEIQKQCLVSIKKEAQSHHDNGLSEKYKDFVLELSVKESNTGNEEVDSFLNSKNQKFVSIFHGFDFIVNIVNYSLSTLEQDPKDSEGHSH